MRQINILECFEKITGEKIEYWRNNNDIKKKLSSMEGKNNECNRKRRTVTRPLDYKQRVIQGVKNGKTKVRVAKEFGLPYGEVINITRNIKSSCRLPIPFELQEKIRERVKNGESAYQLSKKMRLSYNKVKEITRDIPSTVQLNRIKLNKLRSKIRWEVKNGKLKKQVAEKYDIPYHQVQKITKDIRTPRSIPVEIQRKIHEEVKEGKTKIQVSKELKVSYDSVRKYTMDIPGYTKLQDVLVSKIRAHVRENKSKTDAAEKFGVAWSTVAKYTKDIDTRYHIPKDVIKKIRKEVERGKSVRAVAKDNNIGYRTVYNHVDDIIHSSKNTIILRGKTLELFQKIMKDGYALITHDDTDRFITLKKYFPSICRVRYDHKTIIFLESKPNVAAKAFLESMNSRSISYKKLTQIMKLFNNSLKRYTKTPSH